MTDWLAPGALAAAADTFAQMAIGAVSLERALDRDAVATLRGQLERESFVPFRLLDRGRYAELDEPPTAAASLIEALRQGAELVTQTRLAVASARCLRLSRGDYMLSRDDQLRHAALPDTRIDVIADLSASASGEGQVVYAYRGENIFAAPNIGGAMAIVGRRAGVTCYDRYLSSRAPERPIYRLRLTLLRSTVAPTAPPASQ